MNVLFICRGRPGLGHLMPAIAVDKAFRTIDPEYKSHLASYGIGANLTVPDGPPMSRIEYPYAGIGYSGLPVIRGLWPQVGTLVQRIAPSVLVGSGEFLLPLFGHVENITTVMLANLRYLR